MNTKVFFILSVLILALAATARADPLALAINTVKVTGIEVQPNSDTMLDLEKEQAVDVEVTVTALANLKNVEILAMISGYEHNDIPSQTLSDNTAVIDMDENASYTRTLNLRLPKTVDTDSYKLRIIVSDKNNDEVKADYNFLISSARHSMSFADVIINPLTAQSGQAITATARLHNAGQRDEQNVKVDAAIPELGLLASDYVDEIKADSEKDTEEMYLKLPKCTPEGIYHVVVTAKYNDGFETIQTTAPIQIQENPACIVPAAVAPLKTQLIVTMPASSSENSTNQTSAENSTLRAWLEGILIALIVLLIIVALIIGLSNLASREELPQEPEIKKNY